MTRGQVGNVIHEIIQEAVMKSGGNWKRSYIPEVNRIISAMGKLTPEPKSKSAVPEYDIKLVRRAGEKYQFTEEERLIARDIMKGFTLE